MSDLKMILHCSFLNFNKWIINPRIYSVFGVTIAFLFYHSSALLQFSGEVGYNLTPWVFPHLFTPPVLQVFAFLIILLFCDAPFKDNQAAFVLVRTGRKRWLISQILYLMWSSIIYTMFTFIVSVLALLPHVQWSSNWGIIIESLASDVSLAPETVTIFFNPELVNRLTPIHAAGYSILFFFLVTFFIGVVIFSFNILLEHTTGILIAGILVALSLFSNYLGFFSYGYLIYFLSPISWMSISSFNWGTGQLPTPGYAWLTLLGAMLCMSMLAYVTFMRKDITLKGGR